MGLVLFGVDNSNMDWLISPQFFPIDYHVQPFNAMLALMSFSTKPFKDQLSHWLRPLDARVMFGEAF